MVHFGYMPDTHGGPYGQPEPGPREAARFCEQLLQEAEHAERCGFDGVFVPERHARTECMFPAPLPLMAAIAARTRRVKIGSYVIMPALYDPVHLAEQAAMIDLLSAGRLILGVGVGYHPRYFAHFGVPIKQREGRFEEALEVMRKAWTTVGEFSHRGKYYRYEGANLTPKPYQKPHPPIWIGAFNPKSIARAGRLGEVWGMAPFFDTIETLRRQVDIYKEAEARAGRPPRIALFRDGWLASSMEEAQTTFGPVWVEECKFYFRWGMLAPTPEFRSESDFTVASVRKYMTVGTAQDWIEQLERWREAFGVEAFVIRCRLPMGPAPQLVMECIQRLGEEVLPYFRGR